MLTPWMSSTTKVMVYALAPSSVSAVLESAGQSEWAPGWLAQPGHTTNGM